MSEVRVLNKTPHGSTKSTNSGTSMHSLAESMYRATEYAYVYIFAVLFVSSISASVSVCVHVQSLTTAGRQRNACQYLKSQSDVWIAKARTLFTSADLLSTNNHKHM